MPMLRLPKYLSSLPSSVLTFFPSSQPFVRPTVLSSNLPSNYPTSHHSCRPSLLPYKQPSGHPSPQPSHKPSSRPSLRSSSKPIAQPWEKPYLSIPSISPTVILIYGGAAQSSSQPTCQPTTVPSRQLDGGISPPKLSNHSEFAGQNNFNTDFLYILLILLCCCPCCCLLFCRRRLSADEIALANRRTETEKRQGGRYIYNLLSKLSTVLYSLFFSSQIYSAKDIFKFFCWEHIHWHLFAWKRGSINQSCCGVFKESEKFVDQQCHRRWSYSERSQKFIILWRFISLNRYW